MRLLASKPGRIFSRAQVLDHIYEDARVVSDRSVESHVKNLRRKLHDADPSSDLIRSVYGGDYTLELGVPLRARRGAEAVAEDPAIEPVRRGVAATAPVFPSGANRR